MADLVDAQGQQKVPRAAPRSPQQLIDNLAVKNNSALELALIVAIASRIEPELLRAARLGMVAAADASAEADLWLSPLMRSRGPLFAVMRTDVAQILRERLGADHDRLNRAWQILSDVHRDLPPALRVQEEITWRTLTDPNDPEIARLFGSVSAALDDEGRVGLARWAARALPELPADARNSPAAWNVSLKATALLGYSLAEPSEPRGPTPSKFPPNLRKITIGLRLFQDSLRLSEPPEPEAKITISVPYTNPLLLLVEWEQNGEAERRVVSFLPRSTQLVRPIGPQALRITTAASDSFLLEPRSQQFPSLSGLGIQGDGVAVRVYRGDRAVLLAFDVSRDAARGLMGFAIARSGTSKTPEWLRNQLSFSASARSPVPSNDAPFQRFRWIDASASVADEPVTYRICPMYGQPRQLRAMRELEINAGLPPPSPEIQVGFTNPYPAGRFEAADPNQEKLRPDGSKSLQLFDTGPYQERYRVLGATAHELMSEFIQQCADDPNSEVHALAFDIDHPDIIRQFMRLGKRLKILLDDSPIHVKSFPAERLLTQAGCQVIRFHFQRYSHSKSIIRIVAGRPVAVLTGSTNFSILSLYAQWNYVVVIQNQRVAAAYDQYFQYAAQRPKMGVPKQIADTGLTTPQVRMLFTPSGGPIDALVTAIREATTSILFFLQEGVAPEILQAIEKRKTDGLFVEGVVDGSVARVYQGNIETLSIRPASPSPAHGKFVVIDFAGQASTVFAGSSNFARTTAKVSGENVIVMQDFHVATAFAVQAFRVIDSYRLRALALAQRPSAPLSLTPNDSWLDKYFELGTIQYQERRVLIGDVGFDENVAAVERSRVAPTTKKRQPAKKKVAKKSSSSAAPAKKTRPAKKSVRKKKLK